MVFHNKDSNQEGIRLVVPGGGKNIIPFPDSKIGEKGTIKELIF